MFILFGFEIIGWSNVQSVNYHELPITMDIFPGTELLRSRGIDAINLLYKKYWETCESP